MDKSPNTLDIDDGKPKKTKKNRRVKMCYDKRRDGHHCGICGSPNVQYCGVCYCPECGDENQVISEKRLSGWYFRWGGRDFFTSCRCKRSWTDSKGNVREYRVPNKSFVVEDCLDCDAVKGPICPNCKKNLWYKFPDKRFCSCGFRENC